MSTWTLILVVVLVGFCGLAWSRRRPRRYRPLSRYSEAAAARARPLGGEATDFDMIARTERRNQSLERSGGWFGARHEAGPALLRPGGDSDYARWYHSKFNSKE